MHVGRLSRFRRVQLFATLWTILTGSFVHGILQARILEWVAMPSSRGSSPPRDRTCISYSSCTAGRFFTAKPPGKPLISSIPVEKVKKKKKKNLTTYNSTLIGEVGSGSPCDWSCRYKVYGLPRLTLSILPNKRQSVQDQPRPTFRVKMISGKYRPVFSRWLEPSG